MDNTLYSKKKLLGERIKSLGSLAVAFSGGIDSTFLLKEAHDLLGDKAIAITMRTNAIPSCETDEAESFCRSEGVRHIVLDMNVLDIEGFAENPVDRCYICKRALFSRMKDAARENGAEYLAEGSNMDDTGDYRPGMRAIRELAVLSPLMEARLTKDEIRLLSRELGLPTWNKPSNACLATRFVHGQTITPEKLITVERAEGLLTGMGFEQVRVRVHGDIARIEISGEQFDKLLLNKNAGVIHSRLRELGFRYVTLDLGGYRTGSMNPENI